MKDRGVIVVDVQGDFTAWKNGSLAVNGTDKAFVEKLQKATEALKKEGHPIYATQDWHPKDHVSFFTNHEGGKPLDVVKIDGRTQVLWPPHCVQNTEGAEILLDTGLFNAIIKKGQDPQFDSYSGFQDDGGARTEMDAILKKDGIKEVIIYGIAMDYCVKATAIHAVQAGYKATVIEELSAQIAPDSAAKARKEMLAKGVIFQEEKSQFSGHFNR
ncbi:MAG: isochorismatase family protein [Desulfobacterales bacterium]